MLQTVIGIVIGVLATILVGHYYYRRSTRKSIRAFTLINTSVFGGLTPDLRDDLHVSFRSETVKDLLQIEILIINDGERSINNLIKPLTLSLSPEVRILDASVLHRSTDSLEISIKTEPSTTEDTPARVLLNFPLLNKGEYFVLKLLLTGSVLVKELSFSLAADDLPRSFYAEWFQPENFDMLSPRNQLTAGLVILSIEAAIIAGLYYLHVLPVSGPASWRNLVLVLGLAILFVPLPLGFLLLKDSLKNIARKQPRLELPKELHDRWRTASIIQIISTDSVSGHLKDHH